MRPIFQLTYHRKIAMHNLPHRVGVARFQLCKSSVHKRFMSVDSTPPKCSHLWLSSANQNFRALHLVFQGGSALFMPPCKNFHHHCTLHLPFCEFTSKMVGGFLFLQARSCFLKFFRFVAFLSHFPANFSVYKNRKAHDLHRVFNGQSWVFLWCARGNSNPWPSD